MGSRSKGRVPISDIRGPLRGPELPSPELCRTPRSARGINLIQVVVVLSPQREGSAKDTGPLLKRKFGSEVSPFASRGCAFLGVAR